MRLYRFLKLCTRGMWITKKYSIVAFKTWWYLSYFKDMKEKRYYSNVIVSISEVAIFLGLRPDDTKALTKLLVNTITDRLNFGSMDLDTAPTRSSLILLFHYKDIPKVILYDKWMWAKLRDEKYMKKKTKMSLPNYAHQRQLLLNTINDIQQNLDQGDPHEDR